jgi:hypothetical protein
VIAHNVHTDCLREHRITRAVRVEDATLPTHFVHVEACKCCRLWWSLHDLNAVEEQAVVAQLSYEFPRWWERLETETSS